MRYLLILLLAPLAFGEIVPGRYIVELTGDSVVDHLMRQRGRQGGMLGTAASARRLALRDEQDGVKRRMGSSVSVLGSVETVGNALFVSADDAEAGRLRGLSGVRRVIPVHVVKRMLDRAVVVNKIADAWNQIGDDHAGEGIKIAIIDTGVDNEHGGLNGGSLPVPASFPRTTVASDERYTNSKVIVARSYVNLLARRDSDMSARDRVGHGTALAVVAAGTRTTGPLATIQGVAPRAYIGSYKVFGTPGINDGATDDAILKAIDDAVSDGMDIINLSLGSDIVSRLEEDPLVAAVEKATAAGVLVVCAAGNNGPDFGTISSPGTARSAIAVGATRNDRTFGASVDIEGVGAVLALLGSGISPEKPVAGPLADIALLDQNGLACSTLPSGSLSGRVALILRGTCTFQDKLNNAERAGAVAAIIYATEAEPDPFTMGVGTATLPAEMVSHANGLLLKARGDGAPVALRFTLGAVPQEFDRITTFSAIGPNVDLAIKPEIVAVGGSIYVATQSFDPNGDMYSADGFALVNGTSFSAPLVAGSLALLKSARPGLTADQYRSLLINSATPVTDLIGEGATTQKMGAGQLDLGASLRARAAAVPATISLGTGITASTPLRVENLGAETVTYSVAVEPRGGGYGPVASMNTLEVAPGQSGELALAVDGAGLNPGAYEGLVRITGGGSEIRVPYWYAVKGGEVAAIPLIGQTDSGRRNGQLREAIYFRVTDAAGVPMEGALPEVEAAEGGGRVLGITSLDAESPGLFAASVRLGPVAGVNTFRVKAGEKTLTVSITGE